LQKNSIDTEVNKEDVGCWHELLKDGVITQEEKIIITLIN